MNRRLAMAIAGIVVGVIIGGCSSHQSPSEQALDRGHTAVNSGVEAGLDATESQSVFSVRGRYNPCRCPAPEYEVHIHGAWTRVIIDGEAPHIQALSERAQTMASMPQIHYLRLYGHFEGTDRHDDTGVEYPRFQLLDFDVE